MHEMMPIFNLLISGEFPSDGLELFYRIISAVLLVAMAISAIVAIVIVLFQPGYLTGIEALGGSSETFLGKNKGRLMESKMKKWTAISLIVLAVFAIVFYILQFGAVWGVAA